MRQWLCPLWCAVRKFATTRPNQCAHLHASIGHHLIYGAWFLFPVLMFILLLIFVHSFLFDSIGSSSISLVNKFFVFIIMRRRLSVAIKTTKLKTVMYGPSRFALIRKNVCTLFVHSSFYATIRWTLAANHFNYLRQIHGDDSSTLLSNSFSIPQNGDWRLYIILLACSLQPALFISRRLRWSQSRPCNSRSDVFSYPKEISKRSHTELYGTNGRIPRRLVHVVRVAVRQCGILHANIKKSCITL